MLASQRNDITFDQLAGQSVTVGIRTGATERIFNGMFIGFAPDEIAHQDGFSRYRAVMAPALWSLTQCSDCRIFQDKTVAQILAEVLSDTCLGTKQVRRKIEYRLDLTGTYAVHEYCVQYNESDYDFICRLCQQEGIYFFFEHANGRHTLVFADATVRQAPYLAGRSPDVAYQQTTGAYLDDEVITYLQPAQKLTTGTYLARDYNFKLPANNMEVIEAAARQPGQGQGAIYEYPGGYDKIADQGRTLAQIRMQAHDVQTLSITGQSNCRGFIPGCRFTLTNHPLEALNRQDYVFISVTHDAGQGLHSGTGSGDHYGNEFTCIPHRLPFRPLRTTSKPVIASSQTAIVTGPAAEEIHTDAHGRVKVKFFWDRRRDEHQDGNMSCWIRVSQNWAGGKWGALHIPRVGQEVIVNFLDGDPDRPIITGRVYHGDNRPPYDLPAQKTVSTIMSNSTKKSGNFNEIRFEDLSGAEELFTHAARDQNEVVQNNMTTTVKANQSIEVKDNRTVTVTAGNETVTIQGGSREVTVQADEKHTNAAGFRHEVAGNYTLKVSGNLTIDAGGTVKINGAELIFNG